MTKPFNINQKIVTERLSSKVENSSENSIICVDLDGTLVRTDTLVEAVFSVLRARPLSVFSVFLWLFKGRLEFKARVFKSPDLDLDPETLPYNYEIIDWLKTKKREGSKLVLATASRIEVAGPVAEHVGIFDEVITSTDKVNLKGKAKADLLSERYGKGKFSYIGDAPVDLVVWQAASVAHIAAHSSRIVKSAKAVSKVGKIFRVEGNSLKSIIKAIRPHQWAKNLLVFVPVIMAHQFSQSWLQAFLAFVAFSSTASSIYIINDIVDVPSDRQHPQKKRRPFASGDLDPRFAAVLFPALLMFGLAIGAAVNFKFFGVLIAYTFITTLYSFILKRIAIADVLVLSGLYTLRIMAGGIATATDVSNWLMSFSLFLFLSLAFMKRVSEVRMTMVAHQRAPRSRDVRIKDVTISGRDYLVDDLIILSGMGTGSGFISVLVFALYIATLGVRATYARPDVLWLACPVLLYWICRAWLLTHRGKMDSDPVAFAIKDKASLVTLLVLAIIWAAAWLSP